MSRAKNREFRIFAHRGDMAHGPENTLPALNAAVAGGAGGVEIDLRMTKDQVPVVFHDASALRVTLGLPQKQVGQRICELSAEEVAQIRLPFGGHLLRRFPPEGYLLEQEYYYPWDLGQEAEIRREASAVYARVERETTGLSADERELYAAKILRDVFGARYQRAVQEDGRTAEILEFDGFCKWLSWQPEDFWAELEYKQGGMMEQIFAVLERNQVAERCILFSGDMAYLEEIQRFVRKNGMPKGLKLGANLRRLDERAKAFCGDHVLYEVGLNAGAFGREEVNFLRDQGILTYSNLGDTPSWWQRLRESGAAGCKTNCLAALRRWQTRQAEVRCAG